MDTPRTGFRPTATALLLALSAAALASTPAAADTVVTPEPTTQNVSAFGTTSAWSRQAADGTYRLVVMGASRVPADAPVRSSSIPLDPDVGPTTRGSEYVVYIRCTAPATGRGCDVYGYDVRRRTERKLTEVSDRHISERAPSYYKGTIAFVRNGSHHGLYVARPGHRPRRIRNDVPHETDVSATHVISNSDEIVLSRLDGSRPRMLDQTYYGEAAYSLSLGPVLSSSRAFWISSGGEYTSTGGEHNAVSVLSLPTLTTTSPRERGDRIYAEADMTAIALGRSGMPELFSGAHGVASIAPLLVFAS
jgi:hypothetical protein